MPGNTWLIAHARVVFWRLKIAARAVWMKGESDNALG